MRNLCLLLGAPLILTACPKATTTPDGDPPTTTAASPVDGTTPADGPDAPAETPMGPNFQAYEVSAFAKEIVGAADRAPEDTKSDLRRRPAETLSFMEVAPGWTVADLGAGGGYTTELLVRAVGEQGTVYGQNGKFALENFSKDSWPARLAKPVNSKVVRVDLEFEAPLPPEAIDLDLVTIIFSYHDVIARGGDVAAMNKAVFEHLKPDGYYVVLDHSARPGSGTNDTAELHRIDEQLVIEQVQAAGFELVEGANFLRDRGDTRDWKVWERGFVTDRFALKFQKPAR